MKLPITLSIFFPAHNEEENIATTIATARSVADQSPFIREWEIIVVDDGSTDRTALIAEAFSKEDPRIRLVRHATNQGYGAALKTGMASASMDYVFFTDADLQFDIAEIQNLLTHISHYDVVIGYRAPRRDPFMRLLNAHGWNLLNRMLFGLHVRDIDCAFKIFKRSLIEQIDLLSRGAMINAEILVRLKRSGVSIKEVPVSHLPRVAGSPTGAKPSVIFRALREMVTLYGGELGSVTQKQALRFLGVGVLNTALDAIAYIMLTRNIAVFGSHMVAAKFFSYLLGTVSSLFLNRYWTFNIGGKLTMGEVIRFYATVSISLAVNVATMQILLTLRVYDLLALGIATVLSFLTNFILSRSWVFKQKSTAAPALAPH
jgi:glycosyltransferase involved in cell wall biosynthesis